MLTGAGGGGGGRSYGGGVGGFGGNGEKMSKIFTLAKSSRYEFHQGVGGKGGIGSYGTPAKDGSPGGDTVFSMGDQSWKARGGGGGQGGRGGAVFPGKGQNTGNAKVDKNMADGTITQFSSTIELMSAKGQNGGPNAVDVPSKLKQLRNMAYGFAAYDTICTKRWSPGSTDKDGKTDSACEDACNLDKTVAESGGSSSSGGGGGVCIPGFCAGGGGGKSSSTTVYRHTYNLNSCIACKQKCAETEKLTGGPEHTYKKTLVDPDTYSAYAIELLNGDYYGLGGMGNPGLLGTWVEKFTQVTKSVTTTSSGGGGGVCIPGLCAGGGGGSSSTSVSYSYDPSEHDVTGEYCPLDTPQCNAFRTGEQGLHGHGQLLCLVGMGASESSEEYIDETDYQ